MRETKGKGRKYKVEEKLRGREKKGEGMRGVGRRGEQRGEDRMRGKGIRKGRRAREEERSRMGLEEMGE